jgi:gluconolactonase
LKGIIMPIEVYEAELRELVDLSAEPELLATGFIFTEGPVWLPSRKALLFSDIPADTKYRWSPDGGVVVHRTPSHFSNGHTIDADERIIACEHQSRHVTREGPDGIEIVAEFYRGKRLNSPNDVIVAPDGSIIFTDPTYGLKKEEEGGPHDAELDFRGVYRIPPGGGELELLVDDFTQPNGLALSLDKRRLYVGDSEAVHMRVFDVSDDWRLTGGEVMIDMQRGERGTTDGFKVDERGNIWSTGQGGLWVIAPSGVALGRILFPEVTANCNWGDDDRRTLYVTASHGLYRLRPRVAGA